MTVFLRKKTYFVRIFFPYVLCMLCFCILLITVPAKVCFADYVTENQETGYTTLLVDNANLLTIAEEEAIFELMKPCSKYGNVYFLTTDSHNYSSTYSLATASFEEAFGYENGVIFIIDMQKRMLWITGMDDTQYIITDNYCDTITDNIYTYASNGDYYTCSQIAFEQIYAVLEGRDIPKPMKYTCNILLSLALALIINYFVAMAMSKKKAAAASDLQKNIIYHCNIRDPKVEYTHTTKYYNPSSGGSSSSGGSGGGGGGSSGGGHSF